MLTKMEQRILDGLLETEAPEETAIAIIATLTDLPEQAVQFSEWLESHPGASEQEVLNTFGSLIISINKQ